MRNLAILSPNANAATETFIAAHRKLPFNITFIYGGLIPYLTDNTKINQLKYPILWYKVLSKVFKTRLAEEKLLKGILKKNKIEGVLAEFGMTAANSLAVIKALKLPLVVHFHGLDASVHQILEDYKEKYLAVFRYAKSIIVVSKAMQGQLISIGCPPEKITINTYGPEPSFHQITANLNNQFFLSVGRFVEKKAPYLTVIAFSKVVAKYPNAKLYMIGDGPLLGVTKNLIAYYGLGNNIELLGLQTPETVKQYLSNCMAFVQHSIQAEDGDCEGTPVAIIEAQAAGVPVVSTYHAGIPDVVIHEKTGYLVEEKDVDGMANYMIKLLEEKEIRNEFSKAAKEHIRSNFTMEKHLNGIAALFNG
ncbi:MAG: glycosyltransferase [Chitinophagaceae bacterium]|nr:MAG: glycosyltransferase [Chitinophagaceae bacterium]